LLHCGSDPAIPGASLFFGDASHSDSWVGMRMLDRVLTYRSGDGLVHARTNTECGTLVLHIHNLA
ncbi:unnamed protein product, partial [Urochloa humidicola]